MKLATLCPCIVLFMVLVLTYPELPPLHCPVICLFWARSAVFGSSLGFAVVYNALFHLLPIPFLALSGSACHVPSYWHRMRSSSEIVTSRSFLVFRLNHNLSILSLTSFSIHHSGHFFSVSFSAVAKNSYDCSSEDLISSSSWGGLGTDQ